MRPTPQQIIDAVEEFEALRYFPIASVGTKKSVARLLGAMVSTQEQLAWLVSTMINHGGEWQGTAQLRALFCARFKPGDGIEATEHCKVAGYTPADCESDYISRQLPTPDVKLLASATGVDEEFQQAIDALSEKVKLKAREEQKIATAKDARMQGHTVVVLGDRKVLVDASGNVIGES